ncbi:paired amphipathic helix protein Sin3-like 2 isoform X1 [Capsicum annuum]|uniref:paired amphipathic helix protein Sin3-like 2 isoform X1 n=1 Tax=Capsicum annuum TaxID=4072 RepID=UPI0007BEFDEC|nr:paired amphipathic helix protein Sin3-like 2 isoform X1 [Capsicum annuum]XP_016569833.1 paired amphipathic helix protein Sin3-like 2 isoform X1 [Capsicum annuum]XP_047267833.1 paired amphipathic helix protein Sin3-like 2 isoform X1 [Capsicum annuum]
MVLFSVWQHQHNIYLFEFTSSPPRLSIQLMDNGGDKFEVVVVSIDPNFPVYLHNDYFSVKHGKKESSAVMLKSKVMQLMDSFLLWMLGDHVMIVILMIVVDFVATCLVYSIMM